MKLKTEKSSKDIKEVLYQLVFGMASLYFVRGGLLYFYNGLFF